MAPPQTRCNTFGYGKVCFVKGGKDALPFCTGLFFCLDGNIALLPDGYKEHVSLPFFCFFLPSGGLRTTTSEPFRYTTTTGGKGLVRKPDIDTLCPESLDILDGAR